MASATKTKGSLIGQRQVKILMDLFTYVVLAVVGIIFIMPFAWMVANSFKDIRGITLTRRSSSLRSGISRTTPKPGR